MVGAESHKLSLIDASDQLSLPALTKPCMCIPALMVCDHCCCGCTGLRGKLPKAINLPASITVPFGSFEEVLSQAANKKIKKQLDAAIKDIPVEKAEEALSKCRELVMQVSLQPCLLVPPA